MYYHYAFKKTGNDLVSDNLRVSTNRKNLKIFFSSVCFVYAIFISNTSTNSTKIDPVKFSNPRENLDTRFFINKTEDSDIFINKTEDSDKEPKKFKWFRWSKKKNEFAS